MRCRDRMMAHLFVVVVLRSAYRVFVCSCDSHFSPLCERRKQRGHGHSHRVADFREIVLCLVVEPDAQCGHFDASVLVFKIPSFC